MNRPFLAFLLAATCVGAALVVPTGCSPATGETPDVIVLQSGRLRGNVYPRSLQNIATLQHYPYLAGYVNQVRAEAAKTGAKVLLVDLGDSLGGSFASHATSHANMTTFFNALDYDALVLGNLDNNVTPELIGKLDAVVLNPFAAPDGKPATSGTAFGDTIDLDGLPVEILANFYGDTPQAEYPERFPTSFGSTSGEISPIRDYQPIIESLGPRAPGTLSLLTWMKFESPKDPPTAFLESLANLGVNAILAHRIYSSGERDVWSEATFYDWTPPVSENILRNNGGFTLARLDLKRDGNSWRVLRQELLPMTANTAPADPTITAAIDAFSEQITQADRTIDELRDPVPEDRILRGYLAALTAVPGTQIAAYSRQSVRSDWPAGTLTASRVFNSLPWTTSVVQMTLSRDQLASLGKVSGIMFLRRDDLPETGDVTVTTSQFFASLLAEQLGLEASSIRDTGIASEFDYFIDALTNSPKPLTFAVPEGWTLDEPRG